MDFLEESHTLFEKKIILNKSYLKIVKIIENENKIHELNLDTRKVTNQFLLSIILQIFNNRILSSQKDSANVYWYNSYDFFETFFSVLNKFFIYFNFLGFECLESRKKEDRSLIAHLVNLGLAGNFLKKKIEFTENKKAVFYSLNLPGNEATDLIFLDLKIHFIEPKIIKCEHNMFMLGLHYLSVTKIFRENIRSNQIFILKNLNVLEKIRKIEYFLDHSMYAIIYEELIIKYNLNRNDPLNNSLTNYFSSKNLIFLSFFQKKNSEHYLLIIFFYLKDLLPLLNSGFFLTYFFDFRGRLYSDSLISPIGNRIFRLLFNYGVYENHEIEALDKSNEVELNYANYICQKTNLMQQYPHINYNTPLSKKIIFTAFFEISKAVKSNFIERFEGRLNVQNFIDISIEIFNSLQLGKLNGYNLDFDSKLEILYAVNILSHYNDGKQTKHIIYKDATASAIQLLMILLGSEDERNFKICNLRDDGYWYDTYYFIIDDFKKTYSLRLESVKYFNRKNLKKTIMTYNYSATFYTC